MSAASCEGHGVAPQGHELMARWSRGCVRPSRQIHQETGTGLFVQLVEHPAKHLEAIAGRVWCRHSRSSVRDQRVWRAIVGVSHQRLASHMALVEGRVSALLLRRGNGRRLRARFLFQDHGASPQQVHTLHFGLPQCESCRKGSGVLDELRASWRRVLGRHASRHRHSCSVLSPSSRHPTGHARRTPWAIGLECVREFKTRRCVLCCAA